MSDRDQMKLCLMCQFQPQGEGKCLGYVGMVEAEVKRESDLISTKKVMNVVGDLSVFSSDSKCLV